MMTYLHTRSQNIKKNGGGDKYDLIANNIQNNPIYQIRQMIHLK